MSSVAVLAHIRRTRGVTRYCPDLAENVFGYGGLLRLVRRPHCEVEADFYGETSHCVS